MSDLLYVHPDYRLLLAAGGLRCVADFMQVPASTLDSRHRDRQSVLLTLAGSEGPRQLVLKRTAEVRLRDWMEDLVRLRRPVAPPVREYRAINLCRELGIHTVQPVACGERTRLLLPREGFLLVEPPPTAYPLDELVRAWRSGSCPAPRRVHELFYEFGRLVGRLHQAHMRWPDLAPQHVYVQAGSAVPGGSYWQFLLIDLERLAAASARRRQIRDLKHLLRESIRLWPVTNDWFRFALGYVATRYPATVPLRRRLRRAFGWAAPVLRSLRSAAGSLERERFVRIGRVTINAEFLPLLQENGLGSFRRVFEYPNGIRLDKAGLTWRQRIRMDLVGLDGQSRAIFLKRYDRPPLYAQLQRVLFCRPAHSTAWWEWRQIRRLRRAGIATPTPVALGEKMAGWQEKRSFIALAAAPGQSLERWVPRHLLPPNPRITIAQKCALLRRLACLVRRLHQVGFCHRDLYLSHIFLDLQPSALPHLTLIDLQRVFRPRWRRRRWQIKDLAALYYSSPAAAISFTDRLRFFLEYLGRSRLQAADKKLARKILAKARRIAWHNRRRADRLTHGAVAV